MNNSISFENKQKKSLWSLYRHLENQQKRPRNLKSSLDTAVSLHFHCSPGRQHIEWLSCLVVLRVTPHGCRLQVISFYFLSHSLEAKPFYSLTSGFVNSAFLFGLCFLIKPDWQIAFGTPMLTSLTTFLILFDSSVEKFSTLWSKSKTSHFVCINIA